MSYRNRLILLASVLVVGVGLDQWSKVWADRNLGTIEHPVPVAIGPGDAGKPIAEVLKARLDLDDATLDDLFARGPAGLNLLQRDLKPKPGDKAFRQIDGKPRLTWYWAFHHRTLDMPPRRIPQGHNQKRDLESAGAATVEEYLKVGLPYLGDDARAEVLDKYLYPVVNRPIPPSRPVEDGEIYLVLHRAVPVIGGFMQFKYAENPGAAWGFLASRGEDFRKYFFLCVSILAIAVISTLFHKLLPDQTLAAIAFAVILSGAIGNFIDRLRFNYVIDFIDMYVGESHWPTYNVADIAITVGVGLLLVELLVKKNRAFLSTSGRKAA